MIDFLGRIKRIIIQIHLCKRCGYFNDNMAVSVFAQELPDVQSDETQNCFGTGAGKPEPEKRIMCNRRKHRRRRRQRNLL